jgi:hypothetical protein
MLSETRTPARFGRSTSQEISSQPERSPRAKNQAISPPAGLPEVGERAQVLGCGTSNDPAAHAWLREQGGRAA